MEKAVEPPFFREINGTRHKVSSTFFRGEQTQFHPHDESFDNPDVIAEHIMRGWIPPAPFITADTSVVSFGSCFASHIRDFLRGLHFNVATDKIRSAHVSRIGDGLVNTYAIRQQFEWAWERKTPTVALWHGYDAAAFGYDEVARKATQKLFDSADVFILTYGLSEVWYDEPTDEVFWRAVPRDNFDPARHKFRCATFAENLANIAHIHALIRKHRPDAAIIQTLSPIALTATFRAESCITANAASKAVLRAALDEFHRTTRDERLFYFPSYEIALHCFNHPLMEDRCHVHKFVLDFNMKVFERYFCKTGLTDTDLLAAFKEARVQDHKVGIEGHWSVPRVHLRNSAPAASIAGD